MINNFIRKFVVPGSLLICGLAASAAQVVDAPYPLTEEKQLNFRVFLDAREIGYHRVRLTPASNGPLVSVEANFEVKFLFLSAYSYQHSAEEQWNGECLASIKAETIENGDELFVRSMAAESGLTIDSHQGQTALPGCIRSFAYWDVGRLNTERLLNTQTGEHVPATITRAGEGEIEIDGNMVPASLFVLRAEDADIKLWYGDYDEWLGLETEVKGGRTLSYLRTWEIPGAREI